MRGCIGGKSLQSTPDIRLIRERVDVLASGWRSAEKGAPTDGYDQIQKRSHAWKANAYNANAALHVDPDVQWNRGPCVHREDAARDDELTQAFLTRDISKHQTIQKHNSDNSGDTNAIQPDC